MKSPNLGIIKLNILIWFELIFCFAFSQKPELPQNMSLRKQGAGISLLFVIPVKAGISLLFVIPVKAGISLLFVIPVKAGISLLFVIPEKFVIPAKAGISFKQKFSNRISIVMAFQRRLFKEENFTQAKKSFSFCN